MNKKFKISLSAIIAIFMLTIIVPCAFAENTVYTTTDVTGGVRIDTVETTEKILVIPDEIDGKAVVELAPKAFTGTSIEEITIPATVSSMYGYKMYEDNYSALYGMENLTKVIFTEGMRAVPKNALENCVNVKEVVLPETITSVSDKAFYGCSSLKTINLPDSITSIGNEAFNNCSSLSEIDLPEELVTLGSMAFANCTRIESITLPDTLETMGNRAFGKTKIKELVIPANVTSMYCFYTQGGLSGDSSSALYGMEYLEKVTFADCMKTIPEKALYNCTYIKEVVVYDCNASVESLKETGESNGFAVTVLECENNSIMIKEDSSIIVDNDNMQTIIESNLTYTDVIAQIENKNTVITNANGETISADTMVGTGCVIIINNIVQYNIVINYDVDGNGKITAADARLALRASAQLENLDGVYAQAANVDGNDKVTAADARMILRKSAGLE